MKMLENQLLCEVVGGRLPASESVIPKEIVGAAAAAAIGGGAGASLVIEAAGGFSAVGTLGAAAIPTFSAGAAGLYASFEVGYAVGTALYQNSEMVQNGAQAVVGAVLGAGQFIGDAVGNFFGNIGGAGSPWEPDWVPSLPRKH